MSASTCFTGAASSSPFEVGSMPPAVRSSSGSPNSVRSRASVALIADCDRLSRDAARVTLRSLRSASSATSRLRSTERISTGTMAYIGTNDWSAPRRRPRVVA